MKEVLLLKCGEIVLKGLNRKTFEDRLLKNLSRRMKHVADCGISMRQSVVYVEVPEEADADAVMDCARHVFGFATISRAAVCPEKTLESVIETAQSYLAPRFAQAGTFKVETKRGLELVGIHFFSYPYTSERAKEKVLELGRRLTVWCGRMSVMVVPFTRIQEEIREKCHEELFTLIMRRFMMRIAERVAVEYGCGALITGESLGQVASQTMPAMAVTGAVCGLPVFRPCIGMDKEEIVTIARKIDTFETSILPYEDCCTVFTPKHPNTKPKMPKILEAESRLEVDALVDEAVAGVEIIHLP